MTAAQFSLIPVRVLAFLVVIVSALSLGACAGGPASSGAAGPDLNDAGDVEIPEYRLGVGDELRVNVFGESSLSGDFVVNAQGRIILPLAGAVEAEGLAVDEFNDAVVAALQDGFLNDPRVSVEVLNYRPIFLLGEVTSPGEYPYSEGLTVINAVARAGGFTYRTNTRVVFIKRAGSEEEVELRLAPDLRVLPGDTLRFIERFF